MKEKFNNTRNFRPLFKQIKPSHVEKSSTKMRKYLKLLTEGTRLGPQILELTNSNQKYYGY